MLELCGISKSWPGVRALNNVHFSLLDGEIHGLVGENGAGKSTLIKIISGTEKPDTGKITLAGEPRIWHNPAAAKAAGICVIHQELALFDNLTILENLFIGEDNADFFLSWREMERRAERVIQGLGHRINPRTLVRNLSVADQQMVEIARALVSEAKVLILDEPTAVISGREAELLFERMRRLRQQGVGIIYISHRLDEIFSLCDRITVLKDGSFVDTVKTGEVTEPDLIQRMVGRPLEDIYPPKQKSISDSVVLDVENLKTDEGKHHLNLKVHEGEILGIGGMVGSGRTELVRAIFGVDRMVSGKVRFNGKEIDIRCPADAVEAGIGFLTEDRKSEGLMTLMDIAANITAPRINLYGNGFFLDKLAEYKDAELEIKRFGIAARGPRMDVITLSGGNQQKVLLGRWINADCRLLILDEPTRGVDVGAKMDIYRIIREMADRGLAVIMVSSDLPELIGMSDRVMVLREGEIMGELMGDSINEHAIVRLATGIADNHG